MTQGTRAALLFFVHDSPSFVKIRMDGHSKDAKFHPPAAYGHISSYSLTGSDSSDSSDTAVPQIFTRGHTMSHQNFGGATHALSI